MGRTMSRLLEQQLARTETRAKFPFLIKVEYSVEGEVREPLYYANSDTAIDYGGDTYLASVFQIDPPDKDGSKIGDAQITISAVDQFWINKIRGTRIPAKITFMAVIVYDEDGINIEEIERMRFTLRGARWNETAVSWAMSFDENMKINVPPDKCTAQKVPGLA
jgi:hypothetical protein